MINLKNKTLLILGAGRGQIGLYKAAKEMGIKTIAGTMPDNNPPCIPIADEVCYMNILNPDEVTEKTKGIHFDGVATCCLDKGLKALGRLCDMRGLIGFTEQTADLCNNKYLMKQKFVEHNVTTATFIKMSDPGELDEKIDAIGGYPVMIKATDLAGSRGIYRAINREEAIIGFNKAMEATHKDFIILERCLIGREFGAQAFIQNGKILFVMPHGDILFHGSTDVPVGHYVPFDVSESLMEVIKNESKKAIEAVGLDNCAVNLDFIEEDGKVYVLELSGRIGANGLPEVVSGHFGFDYYKMVIMAALGISVDKVWNNSKGCHAVMSRMIYSEKKSGILKSISYTSDPNSYITNMEFFVKSGSAVQKFDNTTHCLGQIVITGKTSMECAQRADETLSKIAIEFDE